MRRRRCLPDEVDIFSVALWRVVWKKLTVPPHLVPYSECDILPACLHFLADVTPFNQPYNKLTYNKLPLDVPLDVFSVWHTRGIFIERVSLSGKHTHHMRTCFERLLHVLTEALLSSNNSRAGMRRRYIHKRTSLRLFTVYWYYYKHIASYDSAQEMLSWRSIDVLILLSNWRQKTGKSRT